MTKRDRSKIARLMASMRRKPSGGRNGGRPKVPTACPRCLVMQPSATEARAHCRGTSATV